MQPAYISLIGLLLLQLPTPSLSAICAAGHCTNAAAPSAGTLPQEYSLGEAQKTMMKREFPAAAQFAADFKDITGDGEYCTGGIDQHFTFPHLEIVGLGTFPLPFPEDQVQRLKDVAIQSPYGQGSETVVDTLVRNSFQIDASKVNITHPSWQLCVSYITSQAVRDLGILPGLVASELYKLLVYEEGGHFKMHRDSEKVPGMFATLVVQLPTNFTGGAYTVRHAGKERIFQLDGSDFTGPGWLRSRSGPSKHIRFVAHYADCEHSVAPLTSGFRLALVFHLRWSGDGAPPHAPSKPTAEALAARMRTLDTCYGFLLEHAYTRAALGGHGLRALKGNDSAVAGALVAASDLMRRAPPGRGLALYLAFARRVVVDHDDYGLYFLNDEDNPRLDLRDGHVFRSDGAAAGPDVLAMLAGFDLYRDVVNCELPEGGGDDNEHWWRDKLGGGFDVVGNEGVQSPVKYSCAVLCVCPEPGPGAPLLPRPAPPPKVQRTRIGLGRFGGPEYAYKARKAQPEDAEAKP